MLSRSSRRATALRLVVVLAGFIAMFAVRGAEAGKRDLIGGDDIIPINPDFELDVPFSSSGLSQEFLDSLIPELRAIFSNEEFQTPPQPAAFGATVSIGGVVAQAIANSSRPSVVTPYAGPIWFNEETGADILDSFGSFVTNKATTIGRDKLAIGVTYTFNQFTKFNGRDIGDSLSSKIRQVTPADSASKSFDAGPIFGDLQAQFSDIVNESELEVRHVKIETHVITLSLTYGLLDRLDIGALVPYVFINSKGKVKASVKATGNGVFTNDFGEPIEGSDFTINAAAKAKAKWDKDFEGLGDIVLFSKFQVLSEAGTIGEDHIPSFMDLAVQIEVKLPTGDEDEFLGTGDTDVALRLVGQKEIIESYLRLRGELGFNYSGTGSAYHAVEGKAGIEWAPLPFMALTADVVGTNTDAFGNVLDGAVGGKFLLPYDSAIFAGVRWPLNDGDGLRSSYTPVVGAEHTFRRVFGRGEDMASLSEEREMPEFEAIPDAAPVETTPPQAAPAQSEPARSEPAKMTPVLEESAPAAAPANSPDAAKETAPDAAPKTEAPKTGDAESLERRSWESLPPPSKTPIDN